MDNEARQHSPWQRNLKVLWFCTFIAGTAFSIVGPFLPLYVSGMGHFSKFEITLYSGMAFASNFLVVAIASPFWGKLADRSGRKVMLLRAALGMAICNVFMGMATNVWVLIGLRGLQGVFAGYIPNAQALIASQTPLNKSGAALSTLTTGSTSGFLLGPVIGGTLAAVFSIRITFFITAALLLLTFFLSLFFVKEQFQPVATGGNAPKYSLFALPNPRLIILLLVSTMIVQLGNMSISPIISLYVQELMHNTGAITIVAGIISALPGFSNIIAAPRLGKYGDKHGSGRVLLFGYVFAVLMYFPQGFIPSIWIFAVLRFMVGISDGALFPEIQTLLTKNTPFNMTSYVFSWNQSFQALGSMFGSLLGGFIAGIWNYNAVFISTAFMLLINFILLWVFAPEVRHAKHTTSGIDN